MYLSPKEFKGKAMKTHLECTAQIHTQAQIDNQQRTSDNLYNPSSYNK